MALKIVFVLVLLINILRFVGLEKSPPGFYHDEVVPATHILCLAQTGHDGNGVSWPLFSAHPVAGSGVSSPFHLYGGVLWEKVFGDSIGAFRGFSAFITTLTIVGLFLLGRLFFGTEGGLIAALAGSLSPLGFQFSRMGFDDPTLFTFGVVFGLFFFLRGKKWCDGLASAFFFNVAMYSYPTAKVHVALFFIPLLYLKFKSWAEVKSARAFLLSFCLGGGVLLVPLLWKMFDGSLMERSNFVTIFYPPFLQQNGGSSFLNIIGIFIHNLSLHFSPEFLFIHGDHNLRHSTQFVGEWSWLDVSVIFILILLLSTRRIKIQNRRLFLFLILGYVAAIIPAALTWESVPHALRAVGLWPFLALLVAFAWTTIRKRWAFIDILFISVALIFAVAFGWNYSQKYPQISGPWFDQYRKEMSSMATQTGDWKYIMRRDPSTPRIVLRYFMMTYGGYSCDGSAQ